MTHSKYSSGQNGPGGSPRCGGRLAGVHPKCETPAPDDCVSKAYHDFFRRINHTRTATARIPATAIKVQLTLDDPSAPMDPPVATLLDAACELAAIRVSTFATEHKEPDPDDRRRRNCQRDVTHHWRDSGRGRVFCRAAEHCFAGQARIDARRRCAQRAGGVNQRVKPAGGICRRNGRGRL